LSVQEWTDRKKLGEIVLWVTRLCLQLSCDSTTPDCRGKLTFMFLCTRDEMQLMD